MNREEILYLLRRHVITFSAMLEAQNSIPKNVLWAGGGPENIGGLRRINELFEQLPETKPYPIEGGVKP